ncbi:MAG: WD40/YVTN/BNR-like repeat-containing protein [Rhodopila sp.]
METRPPQLHLCPAAWLCLLMLAMVLHAVPAAAHDASAYGGLFRSRSMGGAWLNADVGLFPSAALAAAVDPRDSNHLLMGTDAGLFASGNGGRSWTQPAPVLVAGAVFAVAFSPDGAGALCAAPGGVFRATGGVWRAADAPEGATPARTILFGAAPGRVYLLGRDRLYASDDGGARFTRVSGATDDDAGFEALAIARQPAETLFAIRHGRLVVSTDGGRRWQPRPLPVAGAPVDAVSPDPAIPGRLWAASADRLFRSEDGGGSWQAVGNPLPEPHTITRGIAADAGATMLVVTTHRGTYRSTDAGAHWMLEEGNLPIHLEAGPLARDPAAPATLYAVYSLIPYPEVWRNAVEGSNLLARADPMSLIGGAAFLLLLLLAGIALVAWLLRWRRAIPEAAR